MRGEVVQRKMKGRIRVTGDFTYHGFMTGCRDALQVTQGSTFTLVQW